MFDQKSSKQRGKIRTLKIIEQKKEKTEFFSQLAKEIDKQFPKEHIDFLLSFCFHHKNSKSKRLVADNNNYFRTPNGSLSQRSSIFDGDISSPISKVDLNVFQTFYRSKQAALRKNEDDIEKKKECMQEKVPEKRFTKQSFPRYLFEVDKKMKKNYQRVKQGLKFGSAESTYRKSQQHQEWNMNLFSRSTKTQRKNRYKTECQDENQATGDKIPTMFLRDLAARKSCLGNKMEGIRQNQDQRWECFKGHTGGWRRRYKYG